MNAIEINYRQIENKTKQKQFLGEGRGFNKNK